MCIIDSGQISGTDLVALRMGGYNEISAYSGKLLLRLGDGNMAESEVLANKATRHLFLQTQQNIGAQELPKNGPAPLLCKGTIQLDSNRADEDMVEFIENVIKFKRG